MAVSPKYGNAIAFGSGQAYAEGSFPADASGVADVSLKVNGVTLADNEYSILQHKLTFNQSQSLDFIMHKKWDESPYDNNQEVQLIVGGITRFLGRVLEVDLAGAEKNVILYRCLDYMNYLRRVPYKDTGTRGMTTASHYVVYNADIGEPEYSAAKADKNCGQIIQDIFDNTKDDISDYVTNVNASELTNMDIKPPRLEFVGLNVLEAIQEVMKYQFNFGFWLDPADKVLHFQSLKKDDLTTFNVNPSNDAVQSTKIKKNIVSSVSKVIFEGSHEIETVAEFDLNTSSYLAAGVQTSDDFVLTSDWDTSLEATFSRGKSEDDPELNDYRKVFKHYQINSAHIPLLPYMVNPSGSVSVIVFNPVIGELGNGNWEPTSAHINLTTGEVILNGNHADLNSDGITWDFRKVRVRYAYNSKTPLNISVGHQGTANSARGWENTWVFFDPEFKKQDIHGIVSAIEGTTIYDHTMSFDSNFVGKKINGQNVDSITGGGATLASVAGISVGDTWHCEFRDDTDATEGMTKIANAILDMLDYEQNVGQITLLTLDYVNVQLGSKVNVTGTSDSDLTSMETPLRSITWDFRSRKTILNTASGFYLNALVEYDELKRRFIKDKEKRSPFKAISLGSGGGSNSSSEVASSGGLGNLPEHKHSSSTDGGVEVTPEKLGIITSAGTKYFFQKDTGDIFIVPNILQVRLGSSTDQIKPAGLDVWHAHWKS